MPGAFCSQLLTDEIKKWVLNIIFDAPLSPSADRSHRKYAPTLSISKLDKLPCEGSHFWYLYFEEILSLTFATSGQPQILTNNTEEKTHFK